MQHWEYLTKILEASVKEFRQAKIPGFEDYSLPLHAILTVQHQLNALGKEGWELVTLQPVIKGENEDVLLFNFSGNLRNGAWANHYLCVFKRALLTP